MSDPFALTVDAPDWLPGLLRLDDRYPTAEERMRLAVRLAQENVAHGTGGPFGAAVFERESGRLVAAGVNSVVRLNNCVLHAEVAAIMLAQRRWGSFTLAAPGLPAHELVSSCEPCAMCLGATLWSGVRRLVFGATREDAHALAFDEGPVFAESYAYLEARGIAIERGFLRAEACTAFTLYRERGGPIYNG